MFDLPFNGFLSFMVTVWLIGMVKRKSLAGLTGSLKSSLALLIVPGLFIVLRVREWMEVNEPPPSEIEVSTISLGSAISSSK